MLAVEGQNANGSAVATTAVNGPFEVLDISGNSVILNLAAVQDLLAKKVAEDFATIGLAGEYSVTAQVTGAPVVSYAKSIKVN